MFFQLSQRGVNHLAEIRVTSGGRRYAAIKPKSDPAGSKVLPVLPGGTRTSLSIQAERQSGFAGGLTAVFEEIGDEINLEVDVEPCEAFDEIHYLELVTFASGDFARRKLILQRPQKLAHIKDVLITGTAQGTRADARIVAGSTTLQLRDFAWIKSQESTSRTLTALAADPALAPGPKTLRFSVSLTGDLSTTLPPEAHGIEQAGVDDLVSAVRRRLGGN
jgi:hypothetical protein